MHILFIPAWFETPDRPTAGKAVKDLAYALVREGIKVNFLFQSRAPLPLVTLLNHQIEVWNSYSIWPGKLFPLWNRVSLWSYHRVFKKYIRNHGIPDLIHIHSYPQLPLANSLFRKYGLRVIYTEHSSKIAQQKLNWPERYLIKICTGDYIRVVAVSEFLKAGLTAILPGINIQVIPNTIDFDYFLPGSKSPAPRLIMINLLNKNKQVNLGIEVFASWMKRHPVAELHIIGDGPEQKALERLAGNYGLQHAIKWWGEKQVEEWLPQLQASTALLLLSRYESFGVVVLEALACGVPVVCLQNHGIDDILKNTRIPVLPADADEKQITDALDEIILQFDPPYAIRLREELKVKFDFPVVAQQYIALYNDLLNQVP